jgi:hypothetical protein
MRLATIAHNALDEQRRIVAYLDGLQAKVKSLGRQVEGLFESLLSESFGGEI